ncbi:MAG: DUF169 domain-containing protein [Deltaproteobacteria bacterium]|nr:DUF169 domain-containing protein [Deltaproteobacteria bacterium]
MTDWKSITREMEMLLRLRTYPVAYKRLDDAAELDAIPKVRRLNRFKLFCQLPGLVRNRGWTVGVTVEEGMSPRCSRIHGLDRCTDESKAQESAQLSTTWFASPEEAMRQQADYPRVPPGEAIVLAPLAAGKFEPDVVLIYGNPAQLMMLLCGLQKIKYERFEFFFIGEGACADSLAQCYTTGRPSLAIPCFGERRFGEVLDDEMVLALPPSLVETALEGSRRLSKVGLRLPIPFHGAEFDPEPALALAYPPEPQHGKP